MLAQSRLGKTALRPLVQSRNLFFLPTLASAATGFFLRDSIRLANSLEDNVNQRKSSNDVILEESEIKPYFSRPAKKYPNHIPLYPYEKVAMFVTSAIGAFLHPEKNQYIVALGESTAIPPFLKRLRKQMLDDETGRQILKDRPNITSTSLDLDKLAALPENTFGRTYYEWLKREGCSPDTRVPVRFIDDEELAFVFQRYRQCHDFYHALAGLPISREGEIAVKFFEFLTLGIPFAGMGAVFAPLNIRKSQRDRLLTIYYPWAISSAANCKKHLINVYWENIMEKDVNELRDELGITLPPDMRELRRIAREKRRALQANPSPTP
ncbi:DEKNAAC100493 [Brettanomyces naardenensis]|uniref:4-hydroxy-3-methoxy-5-polyprenylbenzoate decarboxylase n=1 Tax=Brettanomyces naardenensis TaxID=13370 RepID=A0A448YFK0_BRENA|nr:DEKNAAC100493 [Brettanomyces naardenensis]